MNVNPDLGNSDGLKQVTDPAKQRGGHHPSKTVLSGNDPSSMGRRTTVHADDGRTGGRAVRYGPEQIQSDARCMPNWSCVCRSNPAPRVRRPHGALQALGAPASWRLLPMITPGMAKTRSTFPSSRQTADSSQVLCANASKHARLRISTVGMSAACLTVTMVCRVDADVQPNPTAGRDRSKEGV